MKPFVFIILFAGLLFFTSRGQNAEASFHLTSGLFSFGGKSAVDSTWLEALNPYGKQSNSSFGLAFQIQWISAKKFIVGFQTGYDALSTSVIATEIYRGHFFPDKRIDSKVTLKYKFINFYPFAGKRFSLKQNDFDITTGILMGMVVTKGKLSVKTYSYPNGEIENPAFDLDIRPTILLTCYFKNKKNKNRFGLTAGYSYGISNYVNEENEINYLSQAYSRMIRFGILYSININTKD